LTCRKALFNLPNGKNLLKYWDVDEEDKNDLFLTFKHCFAHQSIVDLLIVRFSLFNWSCASSLTKKALVFNSSGVGFLSTSK
jgi:hypothetical protein